MNRFLVRSVIVLGVVVSAGCTRAARGPSPVSAPDAAPALPAGVTPQLIIRGDSIYRAPNAACQRCHAADASGGTNGPSLRSGPWLQSDGSYEKILSTIVEGVPRDRIKDPARRFAMNPRGGPMNLTDDQARALAAFVWSISRSKTSGT